ncbi:hypothetical protein L915_09801 [Phytophthora nicotianae]|uniref:dolichol kinase n=1 Tax=Phytophthora nicotianae TaxID=4792 RepID=W2IXE0_PHYNI|nr:hypothetical protein L915_09801 [Phytophthora nicotianae]ETL38781.1 hypothetical protein L916_09708 [Phytophthora nicotianae]
MSKVRKCAVESRRAQVAEALVLLLTAAWITHLVQKEEQQESGVAASLQAEQRLLQSATMSHVLFVLHVLGFSAVLWSIYRPQALSRKLQIFCRRERDAGLVVGCMLPPLVLLSRLLVGIYQEDTFSSFTFFYAWTSVSIGVSLLFKVVVFGTATSFSVNMLVDGVLLPVVFGSLSPVEAEWRYLLATGGRVIVAAVLAAGFKLLPRSFTVGEALLVAQGVGLCAYDLLLVTVNRLNEYDVIDLPPSVLHSWLIFDVDRPDNVLALEVGMLGTLLVCVGLVPLLRSYGAPSPTTIVQPLSFNGTVGFVLTVAVVVGGVVYPWSCFLLQTWNPFAWLFDFLTESSSSSLLSIPPRFALMGYWATCLVVLLPLFGFISNRFALRNIVTRKLFHVLVVLMLGPASLFDASMLSLSYGVALSVFFLLECVRALSLPPFGRLIAEFMRSFIDHREAGRVILTHSYLLLGCALPLWLVPSPVTPSPLVMNAGVVALGVGDAMGAVVGSSIGKHKIFGSKTVEGSAAVFFSMAFASLFVQNYHASVAHGEFTQAFLLIAGIFLTTVLEAATAQIDNLVLPLFFYTACNLVACHRV